MTPVRPLGPRRLGNQQSQQNQQPQQIQQQEPPALPPPMDYHDPKAVLGKPKTLLMLWHEYLYGLDENKPAKDFTPAERGKVKTQYSHRKSFWSVMVRLIRAGYDELTAIDLIHQAYGAGKPVSFIIQKLTRAKSIGYHPNIAVVMGN